MPIGNAAPLQHLRFPVDQSKGRRYPELPHPYRNPFQRDRDRVIHARAFRRLADKTQVFTPSLSDHFRNRLTHTIEVAQIARTIANALGLDEDLTEALALAHDIGHPPFAHAGEEVLDRQMARFGDRFDHNLHALRIVERFETPYACFPGLNLTFEVREGIAKHSRDFERGESLELDEFLPGLRPPLEAQIIDLADEIAYNTADLDDAVASDFFSSEEIAGALPKFAEVAEVVGNMYAGASERVRFQESLRALLNWLVTQLLEGTLSAVREAGIITLDEVRGCPDRLIRFTPESGQTSARLKEFLRGQLYFKSTAIMEERRQSSEMLAELFQFFLDNPNRLPRGYAESGEPIHRQVCDYIAGMTDGFFRRIHNQMLSPNSPVVAA